MRGKAMEKICHILQNKKNVRLSNMKALEFFARDGSWQTAAYADKIATLDAWEIDPSFEKALKKNLPKAKIKITDSLKEMGLKRNSERYDLIVIDNGQNCYGEDRKYCEHFDVLPDIAHLLNKKGILIFNINKKPFGYNRFSDWKARRQQFYGRKQTAAISLNWLLLFYKRLFKKAGYNTKFCFSVSREDYEHDDYLHYLVYSLSRKK